MISRLPSLLVPILCALALVAPPAAPAQEGSPQPETAAGEAAFSQAELEARLKEAEGTQELDDAVRDRVVANYKEALAALESARAYRARAETFAEAVESAPREAREIRDQLAEAGVPEEAPLLEPETTSLALEQLDALLAKEESDLSALEGQLAELEQRIRTEQTRPAAIRERLAELAREREALQSELKQGPGADVPAALARARQAKRQLRVQALDAEARMLDQELLSHAGRLERLKARRDRLARQVAAASERVAQLHALANERRLAETEEVRDQAAAAARDAVGKHPRVQELAASNAELAREAAALTSDLEQLTRRREETEKLARQLEQDLQSTRKRLEVGGLSEVLGRILLEQRRALPSLRDQAEELAGLQEKLAQAGLAEVRLEEERRSLTDLPARTAEMVAEIGPGDLSAGEREKLREELAALLRDRRALVQKAAGDYAAYVRALAELDAAKQRLVETATTYGDLLDEHLLWIPSDSPLSFATLGDLGDALVWLLDPVAWGRGAADLWRAISASPLAAAAAIIAFGALLGLRRRLRPALADISAQVGKVQTDRFVLTLWAAVLTVLLAAPWPMLVGFSGSLLEGLPQASPFGNALGRALALVAPALFSTSLFLWLCAPHGVAEAHFRWRRHTLVLLRRTIPRLALVAIPAGFVAYLTAQAGDPEVRQSLSRLAFVAVMGALAWFLWHLLHPSRGVMRGYVEGRPDGLVARSRTIWYPGALAVPLALIGLALAGYFYAAGQLARHLVDTLWLVLAAVVGHDLSMRWLALTRRQLAYRLARGRRMAILAARERGADGEELPPSEDTIDLAVVDAQTRRLVQTLIGWSVVVGLYLIWQDVFPALGMLDQVSVWDQTVTVGGEERLEPITLADLLFAAVVGIVTAAAARNLPGVLEITFLERLRIDPGTRYAASTLARYFIVAVGGVLVFQNVGVSWSSIQWLVAALGVGLGFGLQEIFGNFVSGMIILFERPIRVGDTVTVGDLTGTVSRIRIRATTIVDWDR